MITTSNFRLYQDLKAKGHQVRYATKQEMQTASDARRLNR